MTVSNQQYVPYITVVMPVRNEARFISNTLDQLLSQDFPADRYEIIVVDGMSDDNTRDIVTEIAQKNHMLHLLDNPKRLSSAGRNIGFKKGKGDYFIVVDGHCYIPDDQLFNNIVSSFEKSGADCLGRPQPLDPPELTNFQKAVALARGSKFGHGGDSLIYDEYEGFASPVSNGAVYTRKVFAEIGYVDENFDAAEDVEFNYRIERADLTCYTSPKLTIRYYPRESLLGLFRQMSRYGQGRRKFVKKHPRALTFNQLIPALFVAGLFCLFCAIVIYGWTGILMPLIVILAPYIFYLLLLTGITINFLFKNNIRYVFQIPIILFVIHFALGYGFLIKATQSSCYFDTCQLDNSEASGRPS